jgi:hypothetical protein
LLRGVPQGILHWKYAAGVLIQGILEQDFLA